MPPPPPPPPPSSTPAATAPAAAAVQEMIQIEAPSNLPEGYTFDAMVDGITFTVTVPPGGVQAGQLFDVPYPTIPTANATAVVVEPEVYVPPAPAAAPVPPPPPPQNHPVAPPPPSRPPTEPPVVDKPVQQAPPPPSRPPAPAAPAAAPATAATATAVDDNVLRVEKTVITNTDGSQLMMIKTILKDGSMTVKTEPLSGPSSTPPPPPGPPPVPGPPHHPAPAPVVGGNAGDTGKGPYTNQWSSGLCDCCNVCCSGLWWMTWCFQPIVLGQVMQRLGLGVNGRYEPTGNNNTCTIVTVLFLIFLVITLIFGTVSGIGFLCYLGFSIYFIFITTRTRNYLRRKYRIASGFGTDESCLEDCCCSTWCPCCTTIQMARHTHNERDYPYACGSKTGLHSGAPSIV